MYKVKKKKMPGFIDVKLKSDSNSEWLYLSTYRETFLNLWTPNTGFR